MNSITQPDLLGHWGPYGGRFVPETLMAPLEELTAAYEAARADETFQQELDGLLKDYAGRPTPLFLAPRLTEHAGGARIYFAGDTAYGSFFRDVRLRLGSIDLALLPIGAYEPRWFMQSVHMNPAEAVQAHLDLEASESIGMHFGTFQLTTEGIDEPLRALEEARRVRNIPQSRFRTLGFGESMRL